MIIVGIFSFTCHTLTVYSFAATTPDRQKPEWIHRAQRIARGLGPSRLQIARLPDPRDD